MINIFSKLKNELSVFKTGSGNSFAGQVGYDPFWALVQKEVTDHVRSWRFIILLGIIVLTCVGSVYSAFSGMDKLTDEETKYFFLNLFTKSDGTLPSFFVFIGFLGPLMGISLGFDAVNSEHNRGTLSRLLAQPIPRDFIINAKFIAGIFVVGGMFFALSFLIIGSGLFVVGIPPTAEEFLRIMAYTLMSVVYVAFWLNLSVLFSVKFRQPATSALSGIAVWLFFSVFYPLIVNMITKGLKPSEYASAKAVYLYQKLQFGLNQIIPNELFNEITSTLLRPTVRGVGPLTMDQVE